MTKMDELHETCGGIRELSAMLVAKLAQFVNLGPDDGNGNVTRAMSVRMQNLLSALADRLDNASPINIGERADLAGAIFDILNALNVAAFGLPHVVDYLAYLERSQKGATARAGKADVSKRDPKVIDLAKKERKVRPTSGKSSNAMVGAIIEATNSWIRSPEGGDGKGIEREALRKVLEKNKASWKVD